VVNRVKSRFAEHSSDSVASSKLGHPAARLHSGAANVGQEKRVIEAAQFRVQPGFVLVDIEAGRPRPATPQPLDKRRFVNDWSSAGVHKNRAGPHEIELAPADEMLRLRGQRHV
jgi:hypothetical protein